MKKLYATLTTYEPDSQDEKWGSSCIEISSKKTSVKAPRSVLSDLGEEKIKKGEIVRFFPDDIGYRTLRPLFK